VCVTDSHLVLTYVASDDKLMKNTYTECNTETWNQEVRALHTCVLHPCLGFASYGWVLFTQSPHHHACNFVCVQVMEVFIADQSAPMTPAGDPTLYTEIELTPHNVLYVAKIHNPYGNGTDKHNTMIPCPASGINHTVERDPSDPNHTWIGKVQIPWTLVSTKGKPAPEALYRVNFFRVAMVEDVDVCDADTCDFGCWSPTYTQPPSFHVTPYFGVMSLV